MHRAAAFGVAAVLATTGAVAVGVLTAAPAQAGTMTPADPAEFPVLAAPGYNLDGVLAYGPVSLAPLLAPDGSGSWVWCFNAGLSAPALGAMFTSQIVEGGDYAAAARVAWAVERDFKAAYPNWTPDTPVSKEWRDKIGAVGYGMHTFDEGNKGSITGEMRRAAFFAETPQYIKDIWAGLMDWARADLAATAVTAVQTYTVGVKSSGTLSNIGMQRPSDGSWVAGLEGTTTLSGVPGVVVDVNRNGKVDPGETPTYTYTTGDGPLELGWAAPPGANGEVTGETSFKAPPSALEALRVADPDAQDTFRPHDPAGAAISAPAVRFEVVTTVQPFLTSNLVNKIGKAGASAPDELDIQVKDGLPWPTGETARFDGVFYDTGIAEVKGDAGTAVPTDAKVIGTASVTVDKTGKIVAGDNVKWQKDGQRGTWVWSFDRETQENPAVWVGDWTDGYGLPAESGYTPMDLSLSSDVPAAAEYLSIGDKPDESITFDVDGLWLAEAGKTEPTNLPFQLLHSTPVSERGLEPAGVEATYDFTMNREGTIPSLAELGIDPAAIEGSGTRSWRIRVATEKLTDAQKAILREEDWTLDTGWWDENEWFTTIMDFELSSAVAQDQFDQPDLLAPFQITLVDNWTLSLKGKNSVWLTEGGTPYEYNLLATAWGGFDQPQPQQTFDAATAGPKLGEEIVTFTGPGTKATGGATKISTPGAWTWTGSHPGDPHFVEPFQSDIWIEAESGIVRRAVMFPSLVREYSIDAADLAFDTITAKGFSPTATQFEGLGKWEADAQEATVTLVAYDKEPTTIEVPADARTVAQYPYADLARNGTIEVGYGDHAGPDGGDTFRIPDPYGKDGTHYVFVTCHPGDARTAPYCSPFNDIRERLFDRTPTTPPTVSTLAQEKAGIGELFGDKGWVTNAPKDAYLTFDSYARPDSNGDGKSDAADTPVCTADTRITTEESGAPVPVKPGDGVYSSPKISRDQAGRVDWIEHLWGPGPDGKPNTDDDVILDEGECGMDGESTDVVDKPWVSTQAVVATADGEQTTIPLPHDKVSDVVKYGGDHQPGSYTVVNAYVVAKPGEQLVCTPDQQVASSEKHELDLNVDEFTTEPFFEIPEGVEKWGLVESTYGPDGTLTSRGECGDETESGPVFDTSTTAKFTDTNGDGVYSEGDEIADDVDVTGPLGGEYTATAVSDVFKAPSGSVTVKDGKVTAVNAGVCTAENKVTTLEVKGTITKAGTHTTNGFTTTQAQVENATTFQERVTITRTPADGSQPESRTIVGRCGEPSETLPMAKAAAVEAAVISALPHTGAAIAGAVIAALVLIGGGTALLVVRRRRRAAIPGEHTAA